MKNNYITSLCSIKGEQVIINNQLDFSWDENKVPLDFLKAIYSHYKFDYPKFYKMDSLCKLAFAASELLIRTNKIKEKYKEDEIAIVVANSQSSLDIDTHHQNAISEKENYFPSPSVFVYTLPNILIGEIAIRNKFKGENTFFIFDKFDAEFMSNYINSLLNTNKAKACITGWVEYYEDKYEAFLYIVENSKEGICVKHEAEQVSKLYINQAFQESKSF